jgi:hypothetical protein
MEGGDVALLGGGGEMGQVKVVGAVWKEKEGFFSLTTS